MREGSSYEINNFLPKYINELFAHIFLLQSKTQGENACSGSFLTVARTSVLFFPPNSLPISLIIFTN